MVDAEAAACPSFSQGSDGGDDGLDLQRGSKRQRGHLVALRWGVGGSLLILSHAVVRAAMNGSLAVRR
ncbi:unnamed protein product [Victoria cruziana]